MRDGHLGALEPSRSVLACNPGCVRDGRGLRSAAVVEDRLEWVLLAYRLPREPSTPRITLWRKLRRLGAVQVMDGVAALPADARTREHFDWLADEVQEHDGEASVWLARLTSRAQEQALIDKMRAAIAEQYRELLAAMETEQAQGLTTRSVQRLRRELHRIGQRDFFPPPQRETARAALRALTEPAAPGIERR